MDAEGVPLHVVPVNLFNVAEVAACAVPASTHNRRANTTLEFMAMVWEMAAHNNNTT